MPTLDPKCQWALRIQELIDRAQPVDRICSKAYEANWLVATLAKYNIPFKVHNLGAGVKRITTDTDTCPCCKKPLVTPTTKKPNSTEKS